ncbi:MAG: ATP-binding protein [Chitinophagaceae bacterium]|nr:ATP-binding protein [Oligoflexus sp.]
MTTGRDIDPETASKMFEPFFTTKPYRSSGLGLGLSAALEIAHSFGGNIYYERKVDFTCFHVELLVSAFMERE